VIKRPAWLLVPLLLAVGLLVWSHFLVRPLPNPLPAPGRPLVGVIGHWVRGVEGSYFAPCRTTERFWIDETSSKNLPDTRSYVFLRGKAYISRPGHYGRSGQYRRAITFVELDVFPEVMPAYDCPPDDPRYAPRY
jgi:hypothetical protein